MCALMGPQCMAQAQADSLYPASTQINHMHCSGIGPEIATAVKEIMKQAKVPVSWDEQHISKTVVRAVYSSAMHSQRHYKGLKEPCSQLAVEQGPARSVLLRCCAGSQDQQHGDTRELGLCAGGCLSSAASGSLMTQCSLSCKSHVKLSLYLPCLCPLPTEAQSGPEGACCKAQDNMEAGRRGVHVRVSLIARPCGGTTVLA